LNLLRELCAAVPLCETLRPYLPLQPDDPRVQPQGNREVPGREDVEIGYIVYS
jgi:hypothetical protein